MNEQQFEAYNIPKEKFAFATAEGRLHDQKLETKPVGYFRDAFRRFCKNKGSVIAAVIIMILVVFALIAPFMVQGAYQKAYESDPFLICYKELLPKLKIFEGTGFWDGTKVMTVTNANYQRFRGIAIETGLDPIEKLMSKSTQLNEFGDVVYTYKIRVNSYYGNSAFTMILTADQYEAMQAWQDENEIQVILPRVANPINSSMPDVWYESDSRGNAILDENGDLIPAYYTTGKDNYTSKMRIANDPYLQGDTEGAWRYAQRTGTPGNYNYVIRVSAYNYFRYKYGFEPSFAFGTDSNGYDIFSRLGSGARFSFLLAIAVSVINLTIGAIYGAIEGYYGGTVDLVMERISDILSEVPFMIVTVLFQLHLSSKVGVVGALLYAFVLTGWIGMASTVRMQFYRFKNQEYVLAARTLGARSFRIMFKHIFPNSLGTIVTSCVLVIPGVIFSETSLSYLGIINLNSPTMTSIGTMLSNGQAVMTTSPHVILFPAIFIALLMISFNLFGNGLRDAFNPSLRGSED